MAVYAIGDIQGCYDELRRLLDAINFSPSQDIVWFAGDLVNRGPKSLKTLRFVKSLGDSAISVLGNHDLHALAVHAGFKKDKHDSLKKLMQAPECDEIMDWLRQLPLIHHETQYGFTMVHAGLSPAWDLSLALSLGDELHQVLAGEHYREFLQHMYGDEPVYWDDNLKGWDRLRYICNCFTRIRYCEKNGALNLNEKGRPGTQAQSLYPWFDLTNPPSSTQKIIFGHWSTLGYYQQNGFFGLDSGCLWGAKLTALQLDVEHYPITQIDCSNLR